MYEVPDNCFATGTASTATASEMYDAIGKLTKTIYVPRVRRETYDFSGLMRDPEKEEPEFRKCAYLFDTRCYVMAGIGVIASPVAWEFLHSNGYRVKWSAEVINVQKYLYDLKHNFREYIR